MASDAEDKAEEKAQEYANRSLRTLLVLEALVSFSGPVSAQALGKVVDLPKQTLHRILTTLTETGFLLREIDRSDYSPGPRLQRMNAGLLASTTGRNLRSAILKRLASELGETCNLSIADADSMIYLERVETDWPLRIQLPIGSQVPLHCTASGKLYLSTLSPDQLEILLKITECASLTDNTITQRDSLIAEIERTRQNAYGEDNQEFIDGMVAISVPVFDGTGKTFLAGLAVHAPSSRLSLNKMRSYVPRLQEASADLSLALTAWKV